MGNEEEHSIENRPPQRRRVRLRGLARVASVAAGVQFGWALQSSLLTPYVQELGIPHAFAGYIWLCGPISGMVVQPIAGYYSDRSELKWGRRRPFILGGAIFVILAVIVISFAADVGALFGDPIAGPGDVAKPRPRAIVIFVIGFWLLDLANNTLQGPCRALLADLAGKDNRRTRRANAFFSMFLSIGNVLGYAAGAYSGWYKWLPFTRTAACDIACANMKSTFLIDVILLMATTALSVTAADEIPWSPAPQLVPVDESTPLIIDDVEVGIEANGDGEGGEVLVRSESLIKESDAFFWELFGTVRDLPRQMWCILGVTAVTWLAWYPFWLYNTDWMGREVYRGDPITMTVKYETGVRAGSLGLMVNSIVLGLASIVIEPMCRILKPRGVWGLGNILMFVAFATMVVISIIMKGLDKPPAGISVAAIGVFGLLGAPLAVTYSIPFAMTAAAASESGGGQGLSVGVLNLAVVLPQFLVSLISGPWDVLFGGGNMPAFAFAAVASLAGGCLAFYVLPKQAEMRPKKNLRRTTSSPIP